MEKVTLKVKPTNGLNLRTDIDGEIIGVLKHNTNVVVLREHGKWSNVRQGKRTGFVLNEFLMEE